MIVDAIADRLVNRITIHGTIDLGGTDPRTLAKDFAQRFLNQVPVVERIQAAQALDHARSTGTFSLMCTALHEALSGPWPSHQVFDRAAATQWEKTVGRIAGRWYAEQAVREAYVPTSDSTLATRLLLAHRRLGQAACELEERAANDLPGTITAAEFGLGDPHAHQRTVVQVSTGDASWIYRPRGAHCDKLAAHVCSLLDCPPPPTTTNHGTYSWSKFVKKHPLTDDEFFTQAGQWLALGYLLCGSDFHHDNAICSQSGLTLVDVETILQPHLAMQASTNETRWLRSVLSVGLLPHRIGIGPDSVDTGIVRSRTQPGARHPFPVPSVRYDGDQRIVNMNDGFPPDNPQGHYLGDTVADIDAARMKLIKGFQSVMDHPNLVHIPDLISKAASEGLRSRVILTPTYRYGHVAQSASHPIIADNPMLFSLACGQILLWGSPSAWRSEWEGLMNDDVPAFGSSFSSTQLTLIDGTPLPFPEDTPAIVSSAQQRWQKTWDERNSSLQKHWIDAAFLGRYPDNRINSATTTGSGDVIEAIRKRVLRAAGRNKDAVFGVDFLGAAVGEDFDRNWQPAPSPAHFYGGSAGTLYYLAADYSRSQTQESAHLLDVAVSSFLSRVGSSEWDATPLSLGTGLSGMLLGAVTAGNAIDWGGHRDTLIDACRNAADRVPLEDPWDYINGLVGEYRAFAEIENILPELGDSVDRIAAAILIRAPHIIMKRHNDDGGFAHSTAGVCDAYLAACRRLGRKPERNLVERAVRAVNPGQSLGWCHGAAGAGLLAVTLLDTPGMEDMGEALKKRALLLDNLSIKNLGLSSCHGAAGVAEVAALLHSRSPDDRLAKLYNHIHSNIIPGDILGDGRSKETYSMSLMCGLAGVGRTVLGDRCPILAAPWHLH